MQGLSTMLGAEPVQRVNDSGVFTSQLLGVPALTECRQEQPNPLVLYEAVSSVSSRTSMRPSAHNERCSARCVGSWTRLGHTNELRIDSNLALLQFKQCWC